VSYFKRISYYSKEQLHPGSRLFLSFIIAWFTQMLIASNVSLLESRYFLTITTLSPFFLLLYYRISDEFKDYETDKKYFPWRPIPSGRVKLQDLTFLLISLSVLGLLINLLNPFALKEFFMAWIFTVLMGKWFFLKKWIANNRLLAFVTHAPVGFLLYWYVIKFAEEFFHATLSFSHTLTLIGFFVLPGLTWEILRKTFLAKDEMPGYQTYSAMLGFKGSLLTALLFITLTAFNDVFLVLYFPKLAPMLWPLMVFNLFLFFAVSWQIFKPWVDNLRVATEVYMAFHLLVPLFYLIWLSYV
jgi:hypothetical protein